MGLRRLLGLRGEGQPGDGSPVPRAPGARRSDLFVIPAAVCILGLLSLALLAWMSHVNDSLRRHTLQINTLMEIQFRAATFHVHLEEELQRALDDRPSVDLGEVLRELDRSLSLSRRVLQGGVTGRGARLAPMSTPENRHQVEVIYGQLQELRAIAVELLQDRRTAGLGSPLDERFDEIFRDAQQRASALESRLEAAETRDLLQRHRLSLIIFALWMFIVVIAIFAVYRHQRARLRVEAELWGARAALERANRELESRVRDKTASLQEANAALTRKVAECSVAQGALLSHQDRLRELSSQLTLAEERERRRIATELHDRIGTALAFARMKLVHAVRPDPEGPPNGQRELEEGLALVEQAIEDARSLTFELSAPALYELGLEAALEWLVERTERQHGLRVELEYDGCAKDLAEDVRVLVFQAVRELLVNVVKHARARHARIECLREGADMRLTVADDGVGFQGRDPQRVQSSDGGFGLFSIRERLGSLGGAIEVESTAGGSRVTLLVPLESGEHPEGRP